MLNISPCAFYFLFGNPFLYSLPHVRMIANGSESLSFAATAFICYKVHTLSPQIVF